MSDPHPPMVDPAHYGPEGPVAVAFQFLEAVFEGDTYGDHWAFMDDNLKLCSVQAWLWPNRDHPSVAAALADGDMDLDRLAAQLVDGRPGRLWRVLVRMDDQQLQDAWSELYDRDLGAASHTRILGPDLELVLLVPTDGKGPLVFGEDTPLTPADAVQFAVRHVDGEWRIAGFWDFVPEPGWPPKLLPDL